MPEPFIPMRAWLAQNDSAAPASEVSAVPAPDDLAGATDEEDEAFEELCSELRRFRAALLDAVECANGARVAQLQIRCGTIDTRLDIDAQRLARALA